MFSEVRSICAQDGVGVSQGQCYAFKLRGDSNQLALCLGCTCKEQGMT